MGSVGVRVGGREDSGLFMARSLFLGMKGFQSCDHKELFYWTE